MANEREEGEVAVSASGQTESLAPANEGAEKTPYKRRRPASTRRKPSAAARGERGGQERRKTERKKKALGPTGRQRRRVGKTTHGKKTTRASTRLQRDARGKSAKPTKGSPKAKRRIANRKRD